MEGDGGGGGVCFSQSVQGLGFGLWGLGNRLRRALRGYHNDLWWIDVEGSRGPGEGGMKRRGP